MLFGCSNKPIYHAPSQKQISDFLNSQVNVVPLFEMSYSNSSIILFETKFDNGLYILSVNEKNELIVNSSFTDINESVTLFPNKIEGYIGIIINNPELLSNVNSIKVKVDNFEEINIKIDINRKAYLIDSNHKSVNRINTIFYDKKNNILFSQEN